MSMQQMITDELKVAMKAKDSDRVGAVRILIGEFQRQPEKELSDEQVVGIIKKLIKSEKELLASAGKESSGFLQVIQGYLPQQATEDEVKEWICQNVDFSQFNNKMQAMRPIMNHFGSRVDGNVVKTLLQKIS